jgi:nitroimidazol reductase NimA-like FMN-containing flavoprotein (pyridoxamine 5'-phosphate oxidase superfamily)
MPYRASMSVEERERFLDEVRVAVLAVDEPGRGPLALPVWFVRNGGVIEFGIDGDSRKAQLLRAAGRATMIVQDETPPYRYVSVEGSVEPTDLQRDVRAVATRYLGAELGAWYAEANPATESSVVFRLRPEHWRTQDFSAAAAAANEGGTSAD